MKVKLTAPWDDDRLVNTSLMEFLYDSSRDPKPKKKSAYNFPSAGSLFD